jgi:hypothetical protein
MGQFAIHWLKTNGSLACFGMFAVAAADMPRLQAQTYTVLHRFQGYPTDGQTVTPV